MMGEIIEPYNPKIHESMGICEQCDGEVYTNDIAYDFDPPEPDGTGQGDMLYHWTCMFPEDKPTHTLDTSEGNK